MCAEIVFEKGEIATRVRSLQYQKYLQEKTVVNRIKHVLLPNLNSMAIVVMVNRCSGGVTFIRNPAKIFSPQQAGAYAEMKSVLLLAILIAIATAGTTWYPTTTLSVNVPDNAPQVCPPFR
jgi:hypothetical protein